MSENRIRLPGVSSKSNSAAQDFENEIASHISTGSDLGDMCHSHNHFNDICAAMNVWIDLQTSKQLSIMLYIIPSTFLCNSR